MLSAALRIFFSIRSNFCRGSITSFLPTLMKMQGAVVEEMRVNHRPRYKGTSKYGIWDRAWSSAYDLLAVRWMQKRHFRYTVASTNVK